MRLFSAYLGRLAIVVGAVSAWACLLYVARIGCPFRWITGFPCPFCGMTRASLAALSFDFERAMEMNPLFAAGWFAMILLPIRKQDVSRPVWRFVGGTLTAIAVLFVGRWIILLAS